MRTKAVVVSALTIVACLMGTPALAKDKWKGSFERYEYTNDAGTRAYHVYTPSKFKKGSPVMVYLHGCTQDGPDAAIGTRFNDLAEKENFVVVYPEQSVEANGSRCWNWFLGEHQHRNAGEPSIIAGITTEVIDRWDADPDRVFVNGISAGGAMTVIMAATYPDIYAAATIHAGCIYRGLPCLASASAIPPEVSGQWAYEEMGDRARIVPVMVVQGLIDPAVPFVNSEQIVQQWLTTDDWVDDGDDNGSVARSRAETRSDQVEGGHSYEIDTYKDNAGCVLAERWLIHQLGHAYSGGSEEGTYTDPKGPDVTTAAYRFSMAHPMPDERGCMTADASSRAE